MNVATWVERHGRRRPDAPAVADGDRVHASWAAFAARVAATAAGLREGLSPGDRVAIVLPDGPQMASVFLRRDSGAVRKVAATSSEACGVSTAEVARGRLETRSYFDRVAATFGDQPLPGRTWEGLARGLLGLGPRSERRFQQRLALAAGRALTSRAERGYWERQTFRYADGRTEHTLTPAADTGPSMTLWHHDPRGDSDPYPDRILTIGPRGGIRQEIC